MRGRGMCRGARSTQSGSAAESKTRRAANGMASSADLHEAASSPSNWEEAQQRRGDERCRWSRARRRRFRARSKRRLDRRLCSASDRAFPIGTSMIVSDLGKGSGGSGGVLGGSGGRRPAHGVGDAVQAASAGLVGVSAALVRPDGQTSPGLSSRVSLLQKPVAPWAEAMRTEAARTAMAKHGRERCRDIRLALAAPSKIVPCRLTVSPPRGNCGLPVPHTALGSELNEPQCARPTQRKRGGRMRIPTVSVQRLCRPGSLRQSAASLRLFGAATAIGSEATPQGAVVEARPEPLPLERPRGTRSPLLEERARVPSVNGEREADDELHARAASAYPRSPFVQRACRLRCSAGDGHPRERTGSSLSLSLFPSSVHLPYMNPLPFWTSSPSAFPPTASLSLPSSVKCPSRSWFGYSFR